MNIFFDNIDQGKKVNFDLYISKFEKKGIDIKKLFTSKMIKKPFYILTPVNYNEYQILKDQYYISSDKNSRIGAALHGNSHNNKCSYSYLLCMESINGNVQSIFFNGNDICKTDKIDFKDKVIIIENMENFGNIDKNFKNIKINLEDYSFIFGGGNHITNSFFTNFLSGFDELLCLFDIDKEGMEMFTRLDNKHSNCVYIYPDNINEYLKKSVRVLNNQEVIELVAQFESNNKLTDILEKIKIHKKQVEQELYLEEEF